MLLNSCALAWESCRSLSLLPAPAGMVRRAARVRVLSGEDNDVELQAGKRPLFRSECTYYCPDEATARRCIEALAESDKRLRERPEELMLWDWQSTYLEAEQNNPNGGGT